jgi:hypothetical protein
MRNLFAIFTRFCVTAWRYLFPQQTPPIGEKMPTIEEVIDACAAVRGSRDARRIEVTQAVQAATDSLREQSESDTAKQSSKDALDAFKAKVLAYSDDAETPTLEEVLASGQAALEAKGLAVIELEQAVAALTVAVQEQAEADAANADEDAKLAVAKDMAAAYTKED